MRIIKSNEPISFTGIVITLYGQPGIGKTSIACTADSPLVIDFDYGAHRSRFRKDIVRPKSWKEVSSLSNDEELSIYKTIVLDTVGRCLEMIIDDLPDYVGKTMVKNPSTKSLTLQGYGEIKTIFQRYLRHVRGLGKNIILLAHDKEDKDGDTRIFRPEIVGGSLDEIYKSSDAIGYIYYEDKSRILNFSPSMQWRGKNPANLPPINVPNLEESPTFLQGVIEAIYNAMHSISSIDEDVEEFRELISRVNSEIAFNHSWRLALNKDNWKSPSSKAQVKELFKRKAKEMGFAYNKESEAWEASQK